MINKKRLIKLLQDLIGIDSQNPPGDEYRIACFIRRYFAKMGVRAKIYEFKKRRSNIIAVLPGKDRSRSLLITPHLDTVPRGENWRFPALKGRIYKDKIYGLGATDCKGNLACGIEAINSLLEDKVVLGYNLVFAATADEESGSTYGLIPLLDKGILKVDEAIVLDADDFSIIVTQKGLMHLKIKIAGKRAHGAYPWRGINAIAVAMDILEEVKKIKFVTPERTNKYLRSPTVNIGTIHGGDKVNIVADWCEFELDFRFLPGMNAQDILSQLKDILKRYTHKYKIEIEGIQKPYKIEEDYPLVRHFISAIKKAGERPAIKGSEGATTISFFQDKGIPAVATGFGSSGCAHCKDEYIKTDNLYKGAIVLEGFLKTYNFKM